MHLDDISEGIEVGSNITEGQQIGTMGKSGYGKQNYEKFMSHLHYEIKVNGERINPATSENTLFDPQSLLIPTIDGGTLPEVIITPMVKLEPITDIKLEIEVK